MKVVKIDTVISIFRLFLYGVSNQAREDLIKDMTEVLEARSFEIEDMQKLQKIEALYEQREFGKGLSREERDREVQKVLEES